MARLQNAQLHEVHAAEYPEFDHMFPASISAERKQAYRDEAEKTLEERAETKEQIDESTIAANSAMARARLAIAGEIIGGQAGWSD